MLQLGVKLVIRKIYILLFMTVKYLTLSKLLHKYNKHFLSFYRLSSLLIFMCLNIVLFSFHFVRLYKGCCCLFKLEVRQSIVRSCLYNFICPQSLGSRAQTSKLIASEKIKLFQIQIVDAFFVARHTFPFRGRDDVLSGSMMFHSEMSISCLLSPFQRTFSI